MWVFVNLIDQVFFHQIRGLNIVSYNWIKGLYTSNLHTQKNEFWSNNKKHLLWGDHCKFQILYIYKKNCLKDIDCD